MREDLLLKVADHIVSTHRGHQVFDFNIITNGWDACGSNGCAIGELPVLFPDRWRFTTASVYLMDENGCLGNGSLTDQVSKFFDIPYNDVSYLFFPHNSKLVGGQIIYNNLPIDASPEQVADHIRRYVENGGIKEETDE